MYDPSDEGGDNSIVWLWLPLLPDWVQVLPPILILPTACPAVLGLSFQANERVALPDPSILFPSSVNRIVPFVITKEALQSPPWPSFKHNLVLLLVTS